jgi:DMSO/TMAO reductase YedYZ molybdopterin-dependent catalytic subunit
MTIDGKFDRNLAKSVAPQIESLQRRLFLKRSLSLGALTMLSGCNASTPDAMQRLLSRMSKANDWIQGALFSPTRLAPTYSESDITQPFPFNAFYAETQAPTVDPSSYRLELSGMIGKRQAWTLEDLHRLPQTSQITRHICVEGWSAIGKWGGVPFRTFLETIDADLTCKYVGFKCADDYHTSIDMASALHPQTILALTYADQVLPRKYGFPMKLRIPTKLGFKNPKHIMAIYVTNNQHHEILFAVSSTSKLSTQ